MRTAQDQITEIIWSGTGGNDVEGSARIADAIIAALPGLVKPLGWEDYPINGEPVLSRALVQGGGYFICDDTDDFTGAYLDFISCDDVRWWQHVRATSTELKSNFRQDDISPLKAAAQVHHVAQVMAAFGIDTSAPARVAEVKE